MVSGMEPGLSPLRSWIAPSERAPPSALTRLASTGSGLACAPGLPWDCGRLGWLGVCACAALGALGACGWAPAWWGVAEGVAASSSRATSSGEMMLGRSACPSAASARASWWCCPGKGEGEG